ncbi:LAQU0S03e01552g1_1 [Lachancea quebecensis]|uniref:LAQU0S03e01552g1_1 n=1 Tax=Lachancea quebecensis TaxID=1654605 RepID=A0A0P1KYJ7_9SACH|nr:LAQU0S03e01552g1_1 [Lachancea quebecensis]
MTEVKPCFISLIDDGDRPLLIHVVESANNEIDNVLKFNSFSNMALDYLESDLFEWMSSNQENRDIKNLFQLEGVSVYGKLIKQTCLKIVIGFSSELECKDELILHYFNEVSKLYVKCKFNPFVTSNDELKEHLHKKFAERF